MLNSDLTSRIPRSVADPDEVGYGVQTEVDRRGLGGGHVHWEGGQPDDYEEDKFRGGGRRRGLPVQDGVPLPWPARNREGKRNRIADAFWNGHLTDESISEWTNRNICTLLGSGLAVIAACILAWQWLFLRGMARINSTRGSRFCSANPGECLRNRYYKSLLHDYRRTRDAQLDPSRHHTTIRGGQMKRSECPLTLKLHYDDPRLAEWWSHMLPAQSEGLYACPTPCAVTPVRGEADILVRMFSPTHRDAKEAWQKTAVVNTEAHSFSRENLEATDLLVSFHRNADVVVSYSYAMKHGVPCNVAWGDCLNSAVTESVARAGPRPPRTAGAVMFMSASCDRHDMYAANLVAALRREGGMGVDSFGKCFHNAREKEDPLFVEGRLGESKERIASQYKFHLVIENELVDDYVTEKFYEGLKAQSLMVYLGAPNAAADFAPSPLSFVDASAFPGPSELAAHLELLLGNQSYYDSYFSWRQNGPSLAFKRRFDQDLTRADKQSWQCRLCSTFRTRFCP